MTSRRSTTVSGHRAGDRVLHGAAKLLEETLRRNDHIFRYGGEEFAILMPETDALAAASALERVRSALENHRIPFGRGTVQVFASFGVTSYVHGESAEDLVVRADSACYAAKNRGRNRVVLLRRDHDAKTEIGLTDMLVRID
ncbi:MAG: GGDEF domain-containing protein [Planctomycetes bacterium]|nr:GGDEF domain-containing protein [Planctomycetota bacterium]